MKKVLGKLTGLSVVLAMVFNLFMPMMVSAVENEHFQFNADGGTWRVGDQKNTTNNLDINASGHSGTLTEAQALMLFDSECLGKSGFVRIGWRDASSSSSPILKTKTELLALNSSSGGIELNPVWGRSAKVKVKFVIDNVKQSERDFSVTTDEMGAYRITEAESDVWGALQPEAKYQLTNYKAIGGGVSPEKTYAKLSDLKTETFGYAEDLNITVNLKINKYTVTYYNNIGDGTFQEATVTYGEKLADRNFQPNKTKPEHKFGGWYKDQNCTDKCNLNDPITDNMNIYAKWVRIYKILPDGSNNNIDIQKGMDLVVRADGDYSIFKDLYVDGKLVDRSNYDVTKGSTIVTLKASYLDTLPPGEHEIKFVYTDGGEAVTKFKTVAGDDASVSDTSSGSGSSGSGSSGSPKTGDAGIAMWGILLSVSLVGAAASIRCFRKAK